MATLAGFDATQVGDMQTFEVLPPGPYLSMLTESEVKDTKEGGNKYLQFVAEIVDGPAKGRRHWIRLNLWNSNQTAVDIAQRELGAICKAVAVPRPNDSAELHGKPFVMTLDVKKNKDGKEEQVVKKYEPAAAGFTAPASTTAAPTSGVPAPVAAAPASPPWKKAA